MRDLVALLVVNGIWQPVDVDERGVAVGRIGLERQDCLVVLACFLGSRRQLAEGRDRIDTARERGSTFIQRLIADRNAAFNDDLELADEVALAAARIERVYVGRWLTPRPLYSRTGRPCGRRRRRWVVTTDRPGRRAKSDAQHNCHRGEDRNRQPTADVVPMQRALHEIPRHSAGHPSDYCDDANNSEASGTRDWFHLRETRRLVRRCNTHLATAAPRA